MNRYSAHSIDYHVPRLVMKLCTVTNMSVKCPAATMQSSINSSQLRRQKLWTTVRLEYVDQPATNDQHIIELPGTNSSLRWDFRAEAYKHIILWAPIQHVTNLPPHVDENILVREEHKLWLDHPDFKLMKKRSGSCFIRSEPYEEKLLCSISSHVMMMDKSSIPNCCIKMLSSQSDIEWRDVLFPVCSKNPGESLRLSGIKFTETPNDQR